MAKPKKTATAAGAAASTPTPTAVGTKKKKKSYKKVKGKSTLQPFKTKSKKKGSRVAAGLGNIPGLPPSRKRRRPKPLPEGKQKFGGKRLKCCCLEIVQTECSLSPSTVSLLQLSLAIAGHTNHLFYITAE